MATTYSDEYNLDAIARHNAATRHATPERALGIYDDRYYEGYPTTPRSNTPSEGVRTRSGRSTRPTNSPFSPRSRPSKSPAPRKKERKPKIDKGDTPKLVAPLSVLTKDMPVPIKDIYGWVHRSAETRREETVKRNGYVTRPMNSFMLYRSAFAERTKAWGEQNNHQVVSRMAGQSWPMEPDEIREQFNEWAKIERANHAAAHPDYKFSPSKSTAKRRRGEFSDDEDEVSDLDNDPDAEYRSGGGRRVRPKRNPVQDVSYITSPQGFDSHPYYAPEHQHYNQYHHQYTGRPLPSNIAYDYAYQPQPSQYYTHPQYNYSSSDFRNARVATPTSMASTQHSVGGYGLPSNPTQQFGGVDDLFSSSRTSTPHGQFASPQPSYAHIYDSSPPHMGGWQQQQHQQHPQAQQMYEHQQYLQAQTQPQVGIDPVLDGGFAGEQGVGEGSHFEDAMGEMGGQYYAEGNSADATLGPRLSPTEVLK